ncbi:DinB family protein [Spirosoma pulveris]
MQPIDKASWLASLGGQVECHIQEALQYFQNLDEDSLCRPSPTGGWSIAQCLAHLNSYGYYYLPYLQRGIERQLASTSGDPYVRSWLGTFLIRLMDPDRSQTKFKSIKRHQPTQTLDPHAIVATFVDQQEVMLGLLIRAQHANVNAIRIPLSISPFMRLSAGEVFEFLVIHTKRHLIQAKRNI